MFRRGRNGKEKGKKIFGSRFLQPITTRHVVSKRRFSWMRNKRRFSRVKPFSIYFLDPKMLREPVKNDR
ncbi:hypothetical protein EUTSA_v10029115mg [Eutrema salsugineum]|uniref:Uncharacterized protein n=1 Tax=Eutrema salsugineum TaxID=72664 RepID=V4KL23_EUTSA|nr:hypothetical protein EUTSA_v10029115mg [Eutrema salsugineum]